MSRIIKRKDLMDKELSEKLEKILDALGLIPESGFGELVLKIENKKIIRCVKSESVKIKE